MNGLHRDHLEQNDGLHLIKGVVCCKATSRFSDSEVLAHHEDWSIIFQESFDIWAFCPDGYFLSGFSRYTDGDAINYLHNIEYARCIKPSNHPDYHGKCYTQYINFNTQGVFSCKENYFITGLHKVKSDYLHHIDKLKCCAMQDDPEFVFDVDTFKRIIMDNTLPRLTMLAYAMGYDHISGLKGWMLGDDYFRDGDSWVADTRLYGWDKKCSGIKCEERFKIDYLDWSFHIKDIIYGDSVIDELKPEKVYEKLFPNLRNHTVPHITKLKHEFLPSLKHTITNHWEDNPEYISLLEYDPKYFGNIARSIKLAAEGSRSNTAGEGKKVLNNAFMYSIPARTLAKFKFFLNKVRTTTPYTANLVAKFNVRFTGILRPHNLHHQYRGSQERPKIIHTFGDESETFYTDLRRQKRINASPWLWYDMHDYYHSVVNDPYLANETNYQLKLRGKFEYVTGKSLHTLVEFKAANDRRKRETETYYFNGTFIAKAGPDDKPVEVNYPEISSKGKNRIQLEPIFNDPVSS
uniref:Aerolysin-like C-terminal domain-containing protein n=1 Tax=Biomphalaria glabrata TaxID=6526 RepID=A0A182YU56_BIOGL